MLKIICPAAEGSTIQKAQCKYHSILCMRLEHQGMYVCVCLYMYGYIHVHTCVWVHMDVCPCRGHRAASGTTVVLQGPLSCLLRHALTVTWNLPRRLGYLASGSQRPICLHFPGLRVIGTRYQAWILNCESWGLNSVLMLWVGSTSPTKSSSLCLSADVFIAEGVQGSLCGCVKRRRRV